jgi:hypothetical protein
MKKIITLATAGIFLLSLQGARAQREVEPPAVPPMLEGQKPLATPETKEPAAPQQGQAEKAKPKGKAQTAAKPRKKTTSKLTTHKPRAHKAAKTKGYRATAKTKLPAAQRAAPAAFPGPPNTEPGT